MLLCVKHQLIKQVSNILSGFPSLRLKSQNLFKLLHPA